MIPITRPELPPLEEFEALLADIWQSRMLSNFGTHARRLEALATGYLGVPTMAVVSGDIGLILTIAALGLPRGSAAVVPSFTFNSTVNALLWNGLEPVFADINPATLNLDPASADEAATRFNASLIVATHVFGNPADVDALRDVAREKRARLLFDAAHAYGSVSGGRQVGSFGDAEVFSLSGTKLVTSAEGGLVSTADPELADRLSYLRGYGFRGDYNSRYVGMNGKISEIHAALGTLTIARIESAVATRHRLVNRYLLGLEGASVSPQVVRPSDRSTFKDLALVFRTASARASVEMELSRAGVQTKRYFLPAHRQNAYKRLPRVRLKGTDWAHGRLLCVPLFESLREAEVDRIVTLIRTALR